MSDCLFCKIVRGETSAYKLYEDTASVALLDIYPLTEGHTMVIPKQHYERLADMPPQMAGKLFETVRMVAGKVSTALSVNALTIGINDGKLAGQVIPHLHVHVVPRYPDDEGGSIHSVVRKPPEKKLEEVYRTLKAAF